MKPQHRRPGRGLRSSRGAGPYRGRHHRLDRYTLDKHPDELSYTGTAKVTEFKKTTAEDGTVQVDSTKYYVDVEINFHGTDYDKYTVNVYRNEE